METGMHVAWHSSMCSWHIVEAHDDSDTGSVHCKAAMSCAIGHLHIAGGQLPCGCQNQVRTLHSSTSDCILQTNTEDETQVL